MRDAGGFPFEFVTIAVSDGISMGHEGMRASLVSREIIADSVEAMMHAERFDGLVTFAGCDKSLARDADGRRPAQPADPSSSTAARSCRGVHGDGPRHRVGVRGGRRRTAGDASADEELRLIERNACPSEGRCAGMFTANTMASVAEALGMALPGSASVPAVDRRRDDFAYRVGQAVVDLLEEGIRPRQIMTKAAFENAIAMVMALGGLDQRRAPPARHRARGPRSSCDLDDFNRIGRPRAAPGGHEAARPVPHGRSRPRRRRAGRSPGAAGRRPARTATA